MWVDFRLLENPSPRRNNFALESPLTFYFYLLRGKSSKNKKPLIDSSQEKVVHKNWIFGFGDQVTYREGNHMRKHPSRLKTRSLLVNWVCGSIWVKDQIAS